MTTEFLFELMRLIGVPLSKASVADARPFIFPDLSTSGVSKLGNEVRSKEKVYEEGFIPYI